MIKQAHFKSLNRQWADGKNLQSCKHKKDGEVNLYDNVDELISKYLGDQAGEKH